MAKIHQTVYLNGQWLPMEEATISTQDRGFLFGDGVYEVIPVYARQLFAFDEHLNRLNNSLKGTSLPNPLSDAQWKLLMNELIQKHPWEDQFIYLQVTRGVQMHRDHLPEDNLTPTLYAYTNPLKPVAQSILEQGIKVVTLTDIRWANCNLKAITLLPNIMMKLAAKQQQADDAILITPDGFVTEGTASNVFIIKNGALFTPPNSHQILPGVTRLVIERIANIHQIPIFEKMLTQADLDAADELWLSSSTKEALPITQLNGHPVGLGVVGELWKTMHQHYQTYKMDVIQQLQKKASP
jgi:D-alanine transaminase